MIEKREFIFTGVGSSNTPREIRLTMVNISKTLCSAGFTLRSGDDYHKNAADKAFIHGCELANGKKVIFKPSDATDNSIALAMKLHDYPKNVQKYRKLLGRNPLQVLGQTMDKPSDFVVCWTPEGKIVGGTAIAIRVAEIYKIKVFNLSNASFHHVIARAEKLLGHKILSS